MLKVEDQGPQPPCTGVQAFVPRPGPAPATPTASPWGRRGRGLLTSHVELSDWSWAPSALAGTPPPRGAPTGPAPSPPAESPAPARTPRPRPPAGPALGQPGSPRAAAFWGARGEPAGPGDGGGGIRWGAGGRPREAGPEVPSPSPPRLLSPGSGAARAQPLPRTSSGNPWLARGRAGSGRLLGQLWAQGTATPRRDLPLGSA